MKQRHLLSKNSINIANFSKLPSLTFFIVLLTCLLTTTGVKAIDLTQQIHRPLNNPAGKSSRNIADKLLRQGRQQLSQ